MKIKRIYNELNEIEDISKDKVQIEVSAETWNLIKHVIWNARFGFCRTEDKQLASRIENIIKEAEKEQTTEWAK